MRRYRVGAWVKGSVMVTGARRTGAARQIALVAAPRVRRGGIRRARDQFDLSPLFRRARDYCERAGLEWYILSASHLLLAPLQVIGAQGSTVHTLTADERARWATEIAQRLQVLSAGSGLPISFLMLTSQRYADLLTRAAPDLPLITPLAGMDTPARLRWFDERLRIRSRLLLPESPPDQPT